MAGLHFHTCQTFGDLFKIWDRFPSGTRQRPRLGVAQPIPTANQAICSRFAPISQNFPAQVPVPRIEVVLTVCCLSAASVLRFPTPAPRERLDPRPTRTTATIVKIDPTRPTPTIGPHLPLLGPRAGRMTSQSSFGSSGRKRESGRLSDVWVVSRGPGLGVVTGLWDEST